LNASIVFSPGKIVLPREKSSSDLNLLSLRQGSFSNAQSLRQSSIRVGQARWVGRLRSLSFMMHRSFEKRLSLAFLLIAGVTGATSHSFAQSQVRPTSQQTQQTPPPTTNLTPFSIRVDVDGALNGAIYTNRFPAFTNKFPSSTLAPPQGWRAQDVASRQRFAEAGPETLTQSTPGWSTRGRSRKVPNSLFPSVRVGLHQSSTMYTSASINRRSIS
jgi:hypothetical protein